MTKKITEFPLGTKVTCRETVFDGKAIVWILSEIKGDVATLTTQDVITFPKNTYVISIRNFNANISGILKKAQLNDVRHSSLVQDFFSVQSNRVVPSKIVYSTSVTEIIDTGQRLWTHTKGATELLEGKGVFGGEHWELTGNQRNSMWSVEHELALYREYYTNVNVDGSLTRSIVLTDYLRIDLDVKSTLELAEDPDASGAYEVLDIGLDFAEDNGFGYIHIPEKDLSLIFKELALNTFSFGGYDLEYQDQYEYGFVKLSGAIDPYQSFDDYSQEALFLTMPRETLIVVHDIYSEGMGDEYLVGIKTKRGDYFLSDYLTIKQVQELIDRISPPILALDGYGNIYTKAYILENGQLNEIYGFVF